MTIADHNAEMDYEHPTVQAKELARLARERDWSDCFKPSGELNRTRLAARLNERLAGSAHKKKIHQSTLQRLYDGDLSGKAETLEPMAAAFGLDTVSFLALMKPGMNKPVGRSLPPAAEDLWMDWEKLPRAMQDMYRQQIKAYIEDRARYPELMALATRQAAEMAERTRTERLKRRRKSA